MEGLDERRRSHRGRLLSPGLGAGGAGGERRADGRRGSRVGRDDAGEQIREAKRASCAVDDGRVVVRLERARSRSMLRAERRVLPGRAEGGRGTTPGEGGRQTFFPVARELSSLLSAIPSVGQLSCGRRAVPLHVDVGGDGL